MIPFLKSARFRLLMLVLLAVIPALGLILFTGLEVRQQATARSQAEAQRLVRLISDSFDDLIISGQQLLTGLAQLPQVTQQDARNCSPLFGSMLTEFSEYRNLTAADPQGEIFCSGLPLPGRVNIAGQAYFRHVLQTHQFTISDYQIDPEIHQSSVALGHPSLDGTGRVQAVVTATLDLAELKKVAIIAQLPENSVFFVIDSQGTVLVRNPDPQHVVGASLSETGIAQTIMSQKTVGTVEDSGLDGIPRLYAYQPLRSVPTGSAYIAVGFPVSQVYGEADSLLRRDLIALGFVAALALAAAWLLGDVLILRQVKLLLAAARRWAGGDYNAQTNVHDGPTEFVQLAAAFDSMVVALKQREDDIRQAERDAVHNATRIELQSALIDQREKERLIIARDLHDGPVQEITGVTFALQGILMDGTAPELAEQLDGIRVTLQDQIKELRDYAGGLRPPTLEKFGLARAIRSHADTFQEKHPGLHVEITEVQEGELLPEDKRLAIFRIYQEAMTNIAKHAQATEITIRLTKTPTQLVLEIRDNGVGFSPPEDWLGLARQGHLGLVGIRERAEAVGGTVEISSQPGQGAQVRVEVPLEI